MEQEEQLARLNNEDNSLELIASVIENNVEEELKKFIRKGLGDYVIVVSVNKRKNGEVNVVADVELRSSVLENEVLEGILDKVMDNVRKRTDEVVEIRRGSGHNKRNS